jgi:hypothetical protein
MSFILSLYINKVRSEEPNEFTGTALICKLIDFHGGGSGGGGGSNGGGDDVDEPSPRGGEQVCVIAAPIINLYIHTCIYIYIYRFAWYTTAHFYCFKTTYSNYYDRTTTL